MQTYLEQITKYLFTQSWHIAILVMVIAAVSFVLRNKSSHVRYLLWLIVLAKCLVPPLFAVPLAILPPERPGLLTLPMPSQAEMTTSIPEIPQREPPITVKPIVTSQRTVRPTPVQTVALLWLTGAAVFLLVAIGKAIRTNHWLKGQRRALPANVKNAIERAFKEFGLKKYPRVWLIEGIGQPFVWGLFRGSIYLPFDFAKNGSGSFRRDLLGHELCHILRFDAAVNLLQVMAQAIFWFHPFVWWANKRIRAEREKCCDEMAIARLSTKARDYSSAIVNTLINEYKSTRPVPSLAIAGPVKNIEERIKTMMRPGKKFYKRPSLVTATVVLLLALLIVPTAFVLTARAAETKPALQSEEKPSKSLHEAAEYGDVEEVKRLIASGADVNAMSAVSQSVQVGWRPLTAAASGGHPQVVKVLLENGAEVDANDSEGWAPLYYALWTGVNDSEEIVRELIAHGADVNKQSPDRYSPLVFAIWIWEGREGNVEALLDAGAHIDFKDKDGLTPLYWAAFSSSKDVLDLILARGNYANTIHMAACRGDLSRVKKHVEQGTDVNARDECGCTPMHWAVLAESPEVADFLIGKGADVNAKDARNFTPLMAARGLPMVELLISKGADIQAQENLQELTKLHMACRKGDKDVVKFLISKGAEVDRKNSSGQTPLWLAANYGHREIVELLINKGADIKEVSSKRSGHNPLYIAARNGHREIVELLINKGADVNSRTRDGSTPLHIATLNGHIETAKLLVEKGADVNAKSDDGSTALSLAEKTSDTEIIELLKRHGAKEDAAGIPEESQPTKSLHQAAEKGDVEEVKRLIARGADVNALDELLNTPLCKAAGLGNMEVVKLLVEAGADVNAGSWSPLYTAVDKDNVAIAEYLIAHGADKHGDDYWTVLMEAFSESSVEMVRLLIAKGADINFKSVELHGYTALHCAIDEGYKDIAELLIQKGVDVNAGPWTPLHSAARSRRIGIAELLIQKGAEVNAKDQVGETPLYSAIRRQDLDMTKLLISKGADLNIKNNDGYTPLFRAAFIGGKDVLDLILSKGDYPDTIHLAACKEDLDRVKTLIEGGTDVNTRDEFGCTPLHWAVAANSREVTDYLLDKWADLNAEDGRGLTPFMIASDVPMLERLISKGADIQSKDRSGLTKLHMVCISGNKDAAEFLINNGAEINVRANNGATPLFNAAVSGHADIVELLINKGADINMPSQVGRTPIAMAKGKRMTEVVDILRQHGAKETLHGAAASGDKEGVERLIAQGADLNAKDNNGQTPLHLSILNRRAGQARWVLISQGADVNAKTNDGRTPLIMAVTRGDQYLEEVLIANGADITVKDNRGRTLLQLAQEKGHTEIIELLKRHGAKEDAAGIPEESQPTKSLHQAAGDGDLEQVKWLIAGGADVNAEDEERQTPLHLAAEHGYTDVARALIANGADVNAEEFEWHDTPLHVAAEKGHKDTVELLTAEGGNVNTKNQRGWTPLHYASSFGQKEVAELLIAKGADVNAKDKYGWTPLHKATEGSHRNVGELLIANGADMDCRTTTGGDTPVAVALQATAADRKEMIELLAAKGARIPPLHLAAYMADLEKLKKCLEDGAAVDAQDDCRNTALHYAAAAGKKDVVELLIGRGARVNAKNSRNTTPLYYAAVHDYKEIVDLLLAQGADVNAKDESSYTLLYYAVWDLNKDATKLLIDKGANLNVKADDGETPLIHAIWMKDKDIVELLINGGADVNAEGKDGHTPMYWAMHWATMPVVGTKDFVELLRKHGAKE